MKCAYGFCPKMVCTGLVRTPAARTPVLNFSEQPRAGMPDKGLGIAGIGFQHLKAAVAGYVGDLEQVRTALDGARDEAGKADFRNHCRAG
jgi:hypothetical protein